jgi:hypothetical protein
MGGAEPCTFRHTRKLAHRSPMRLVITIMQPCSGPEELAVPLHRESDKGVPVSFPAFLGALTTVIDEHKYIIIQGV